MASSSTEFHSAGEALAHLHQLPPPRTPEEVQEQLNVLKRASEMIDPTTDYEAEILRTLQQLVEIQANGDVTPAPGDGTGDGLSGMEQLIGRQGEQEDEVLALLNETTVLLDELVRGVTDTTDLPAGLSGRAPVRIQNGQQGIGIFELSGGEFAAQVTAAEDVTAGDTIRVLPSGTNLVQPVQDVESRDLGQPRQRARIEPGSAIQANADILDNGLRPVTEGAAFIVTVAFDDAVDLNAIISPDEEGVGDQTVQLNQGGTLDADSLFTFDDLQLAPSDRVNFQVSAGTTIKYFLVNESLTI